MNRSASDSFEPEASKGGLLQSSDVSTAPTIRFLDTLPPDVGLHITRIALKHGTTDDAFNLAKASDVQKAYVFQAIDYTLPTRYPGRSRSWHWIGLMNGNIRKVEISDSKHLHLPWTMADESLCCMPELYQLDLTSIEKVTIKGVPSLSLAEFLTAMPKLRSIAFTGQLDVKDWKGIKQTVRQTSYSSTLSSPHNADVC